MVNNLLRRFGINDARSQIVCALLGQMHMQRGIFLPEPPRFAFHVVQCRGPSIENPNLNLVPAGLRGFGAPVHRQSPSNFGSALGEFHLRDNLLDRLTECVIATVLDLCSFWRKAACRSRNF